MLKGNRIPLAEVLLDMFWALTLVTRIKGPILFVLFVVSLAARVKVFAVFLKRIDTHA